MSHPDPVDVNTRMEIDGAAGYHDITTRIYFNETKVVGAIVFGRLLGDEISYHKISGESFDKFIDWWREAVGYNERNINE